LAPEQAHLLVLEPPLSDLWSSQTRRANDNRRRLAERNIPHRPPNHTSVKVKNPRLLTSQPEVPVLISPLEPGVRAQTFAEHMFA
jgi:hypothetical protein